MAARVIVGPFDNGLPGVGMGPGAEKLGAAFAARETVEAPDAGAPEIARVIELDRRLAARVRAARGLPLVLAGNCSSCLGTVAGIGPDRLGVVWFDAHADFDTPEDNLSGSFDVMALAILTGSGWTALRQTIPGFAPIAERDVILAGVRDLEPHQRERLARSDIRVVGGAFDLAARRAQPDELAAAVDRVSLHVALDALGAAAGRANHYAAPDGPSPDTLITAIGDVFDRLPVAAAALPSYDPSADLDGRAGAAGRAIAEAIAARGQIW